MKEVAHYIEQLLLRHDCVIIPGLGGFVTQDSPASYVKDESIFLPPYRSVSFNQNLSMNDGLFVHEVADDCNVSYNDALLMVRHEVNNIKQILHRDGSLYISGIGCLLLTEDGNYDFEPLLCGVLAPELYGLDCVYVETVERKEDTKVVPIDSAETDAEKDSYSFRIRKSFIGYAVAVVVAAVLYFGCIAPIQTSQGGNQAEASVLSNVWSFITAKAQTEPTSLNTNDLKGGYKTTASKGEKAPTTTKAEKSSTSGKLQKGAAKVEYVPKDVAPYTVVIASAVPEAGAYRMVRELKRNGVKGARVLYDCSMYRVVYGAYASEGEAHAALRHLRATNNEVFVHSWISRVQ